MSHEPTYQHAEAYCLMKYQAEDGEYEIVWNSRDGVTPFIITLRSGKAAQHVDWQHDLRCENFQPPVGTRVFRNVTRERARELAEARLDRMTTAGSPFQPIPNGQRSWLIQQLIPVILETGELVEVEDPHTHVLCDEYGESCCCKDWGLYCGPMEHVLECS